MIAPSARLAMLMAVLLQASTTDAFSVTPPRPTMTRLQVMSNPLDHRPSSSKEDEHVALLAAAHECAMNDECRLDEASHFLNMLVEDPHEEDAVVVRELQDRFQGMPVTFARSKPVVRIKDPHVVVHSPVTGGLVADTLARLLLSVGILSMFVMILSAVENNPASLPMQVGDWTMI